jgi:hypothetical protein
MTPLQEGYPMTIDCAVYPSRRSNGLRFGAAIVLVCACGAFGCSDSSSRPPTEALGQRTEPALPGDLDRDRSVSIVDLQLLANVLLGINTDPLVGERADFDGNGNTDVSDLQQLVNVLLSCDGTDDACTCAVGPAPLLVDASAATGGTARYTTDVQLVDIDNDGDSDIVWANQTNFGEPPLGGIDVTVNLGGRSFETRTVGDENDIGAWTFVNTGDFNDDGFVDLVASRPALSGTQLSVFQNDGSGSFTQNSSAVPAVTGNDNGVTFGRVEVLDVDLDGNLDLLLPIAGTLDSDTMMITDDAPNVLLMNDGNGTFTRDTSGRLPTLPDMSNFTYCIAAGDVNGDGAPDLFFGEGERRQHLLIDDGQGRFTDQTEDDGNGQPRIPTDTLRGYACEMLDVDEDGDLDVVIVNDVSGTTTQAAYLYTNDGSGHFSSSALPSPAGGPYDGRDVAMGDINGDRLPDLVLVHDNFTVAHNGNALQILLGQCDGSLAPASGGVPTFDKGVLGVAVGDLDGDGRPDIAAAVSSPDSAGSLANIVLFSE